MWAAFLALTLSAALQALTDHDRPRRAHGKTAAPRAHWCTLVWSVVVGPLMHPRIRVTGPGKSERTATSVPQRSSVPR